MDIKINYNNINEAIESLISTNLKLENTLESIRNSATSLDESKWKSKESEKYNTTFIPYLNNIISNYCPKLIECTNLLSTSLNKYEEIGNKFNKAAQQIDESTGAKND